MNEINQKNIIILTIIILISIVTSLTIMGQLSSQEDMRKLSQKQVIEEAKAHLKSIVDTRTWNAQYGGVFVKAKDGIEPNPYLENNTMMSDKNELFIKINPAWMTRQISDISNEQGLYHFKITSLKPINPSNKADIFESSALKYFEANKNEKYFYTFNENKFDFMGSLPTTQACLKCHEQQGYKVGDIRGGIRVSIPLELYNKQISIEETKTTRNLIAIIIISLILISISYWFISMFYKRQYEIENTKNILEEKVAERTYELEVVISHEQHLKDVLKVITEVNEMLINSYSTTSILKNTTEKLSANSAYTLVVSGLIHNEIVNIISKSQECKSLIEHDIVSINESEELNFLFSVIQKASMLKHPIIEKVPEDIYASANHQRRENDIGMQWMIVIPLIHDFKEAVYGIITVFSNKPEGFELEEMKVLENMGHDISIALYSHKQRDSILAMEKEKTANYEETILAFVNIIEQRDTYTAGHTIRVAEYCRLIAVHMNIEDENIRILEKAAILHDIGKVATPDTILLKPGKLSHLEYDLIKQHSAVGADMLEHITIYRNLADIIRYHHSRYDGKGYPRTTDADNIPILTHILIVADAFDAMTTNRIYRARKTVGEAIEEVTHSSGTQFHPKVAEAASLALKNVNLTHTTQLPTSELEQKRMSYFFKDALTELYNEDYLETILNNSEKKYPCLNVINLKKFTEFNRLNGWENGNKILIQFARFLENIFPNSTIFRYHGDDFIILNKVHQEITKKDMSNFDDIKNGTIDVEIRHFEVNKYFNSEKFKSVIEEY
ncbi:MAG: putative nucleotidyltransferase with HDIG domain [Sulfurimonas sp.]|jgi:putative nucleotidyltransferase with HDIG domain|uniref:HD domain-containing phosphohydrolase n=1 Tax=Sulfurimonas sp. TaxID=2022749 RepID=UPI0039E47AD4